MRKLLTGCYAVLLVLLAAWPVAASQGAPPRYVSSDPSDGEELHQAPERVQVTFDQPLDESSTLRVLDECQREIDGDQTEVVGNTMSIEVAKTPSGMYHVEYLARGIGGITGEEDGMFMFTVHAGRACGKGDDKGTEHSGHDRGGSEHEARHESGGGGDQNAGTPMNDDHSSVPKHAAIDGGGSETHGQGADRSISSHGGGTHNDSTDEDVADQASGGEIPGITSSDTARRLLTRADSGTLLLSLALCLGLGVAGGAILRASGAK